MIQQHIVAVTGVIFHPSYWRNEKFLIIQRGLEEIAFPGVWAFPGGKAEKGETLEDALSREVGQETGLIIKRCAYVNSYSFTRPDEKHVIGACFATSAVNDNVTLAPEFLGYEWVSTEKLADYKHIEGMIAQATIAGQLRPSLR